MGTGIVGCYELWQNNNLSYDYLIKYAWFVSEKYLNIRCIEKANLLWIQSKPSEILRDHSDKSRDLHRQQIKLVYHRIGVQIWLVCDANPLYHFQLFFIRLSLRKKNWQR
jgi:hypothetical protein